MKKSMISLVITGLLCGPLASAEDLVETYRLALENDPQLRAARATLDSTKEYRPIAQSRLLPSLSLGAGTGHNWYDTQAGNDDATASNLGLRLSLPLYRRDLSIQLDQADQQIIQGEAQYAAEEQGLLLRVAEAYFNVLSGEDTLAFKKVENTAIARQLEQAKQRYDVGLIAITSVHEAQAAFDQSRAELILAENDLSSAWESLREIVKQELSEVAPLQPEIPLQTPEPQDIEQWADTAQQQNLLIQATLAATELARRNIDLQESGHYPSLSLNASHDREYPDAGRNSDTSSIGLQLSLPIYAGGGVDAATRQASFDYETAQERLDQERRATNRQVRNAYRTVLAGISAVEALKAGVVSAESALEATKAGYDVGTRTMVDVLNAERDVFRVRSSLSNARVSYVLARLQLKQAAGVLTPQDLEQVNGWLQH